jgi:hypothetical protein
MGALASEKVSFLVNYRVFYFAVTLNRCALTPAHARGGAIVGLLLSPMSCGAQEETIMSHVEGLVPSSYIGT